MFEKAFLNFANGTGKFLEHEGKIYLQIDENSWVSDIGLVTCKLVVETEGQGDRQCVKSLSDVKAIISVKPKAKE